MAENSGNESPKINEIAPRETVGRDVIARFQAQFRAAAYECLSILTGKSINRVYCDYQDDFVSRLQQNGKPIYHFYQVKTKSKSNHQWDKLELFGLYKKQKPKPEKIASSIVGKLILHTIRFQNSCGNVVFLTNVQLNDDAEEIAAALQSGDLTHENVKPFIEKFNEAFASEQQPLDEVAIQEKLKRVLFKPGVHYLDPHGHEFDALARDAIFKYSEIDLQHVECEEIINNLVSLVQRKSFSKLIAEITQDELDDLVGIGISDLLEILSISKGAYQQLLAGGDPSAIKSASIIQRKLIEAGASEEIIAYCSKCKVDWDMWFRDKRHTIPEFELHVLLDDINVIKNGWIANAFGFSALGNRIDVLWQQVSSKGLAVTMSKDLLIGGVFAAVVRSESQ